MLGAFKLEQLQSFKPILSSQFSTCISYYPGGLIVEKGTLLYILVHIISNVVQIWRHCHSPTIDLSPDWLLALRRAAYQGRRFRRSSSATKMATLPNPDEVSSIPFPRSPTPRWVPRAPGPPP